MTWPSAWFSASKLPSIDFAGHILSVGNKANDADEIGFLYGNMIVNDIIPKANVNRLPLIVLGHSFGTQLAGRAVFSKPVLKTSSNSTAQNPDLLIGLQPAHSIYRFTKKVGLEGHPFTPDPNLRTKVVITSSRFDEANPFAFWSKYAGGKTGLKKARESKHEGDFDVTSSDTTVETVPHKPELEKVLLIDSEQFIFDHNDIMNKQVGQLIAKLIRQYASGE